MHSLGAIHFETGDFALGEKWFAMAVQRGATLDAIDSEVRAILRRLNDVRRSTLAEHLLKADPVRYAWLAPKKTTDRRGRSIHRRARALQDRDCPGITGSVIGDATR